MRTITCKIHLSSSPELVFGLLTTSEGREQFWAKKARESDDIVHFSFPNGQTYDSQIIRRVKNKEFCLDYFKSEVSFLLEPDDQGGTDLKVINTGVSEDEYVEVHAGWTSVLMNLKAVADFGADLRNHNPGRTWDQGYVNN